MQSDIHYSENYTASNSSYLLFELPDDLFLELEHKNLHIGGEPSQEAIISGHKSSYVLKKCETSNSLLLLSGSEILHSSTSIIKCEKTIPPLHQVLSLLEESPYTHLDKKITRTYSYTEILQRVQASELEVQNYFKKINAFEYKGCWRVFDKEYRVEVLKNFMLVLMEKNWDEIRIRAVSQELNEVPLEILTGLLRTIGSIEKDVFLVDKKKVYQICVFDLFLTSTEYLFEEFVEALQRLEDAVIFRKFLSQDFSVDELIEGIAVKRTNNFRTTVKWLPIWSLSYNLEERLQVLFGVKEKWTEKELKVYLEDVSMISMAQVLMKYMKKVIDGNSIVYVNKLS